MKTETNMSLKGWIQDGGRVGLGLGMGLGLSLGVGMSFESKPGGFGDLEERPQSLVSPFLEGPSAAAGAGAARAQDAPCSGRLLSSPAENILWPE